jgi:AI-2 transport protein TqsA
MNNLIEHKITAYSTIVIAFILSAFAMSQAGALLIPFVVSIILFYVLRPVVILMMDKLRIKKIFAIAITILFALIVFGVVLTVVSLMLKEFLAGLDIYKSRFFIFMDEIAPTLEKFGFSSNIGEVKKQLSAIPFFSIIKTIGGQLANLFSKSTIVFIYLLFIMLGSSYETQSKDMWAQINVQIREYIITKFWLSLMTGILVGIFLFIIDLKFAFMFAVLVFMLNFIPSLGSIIATLLPLPVAFIEMPESWKVLLVLLIPGIIQFSIGNILEPRIVGKRFNIHPVVLLLSLIFWGMLWGIPGAFLAMPLTVALKVVLSNFEFAQKFVPIFEGKLPYRDASRV